MHGMAVRMGLGNDFARRNRTQHHEGMPSSIPKGTYKPSRRDAPNIPKERTTHPEGMASNSRRLSEATPPEFHRAISRILKGCHRMPQIDGTPTGVLCRGGTGFRGCRSAQPPATGFDASGITGETLGRRCMEWRFGWGWAMILRGGIVPNITKGCHHPSRRGRTNHREGTHPTSQRNAQPIPKGWHPIAGG